MSTGTTLSSITRIGKTSVIAPLNGPIVEVATTGSTIRSTGAELPMEIGPRQISTAAQLVDLLSLTDKPARGNNNLVNRAVDSKPAQRIAAVAEVDNSRAAVTVAEATG